MDDEIPVHGDSHASSSHEVSLEHKCARSADLGKHSVFFSLPERPKLRDLSDGPKLQGPRAEDAVAKPYLVLKNLVT